LIEPLALHLERLLTRASSRWRMGAL